MKKFLRFGAASAVVAASLSMSTVVQAQDTASASAFAEILDSFTLDKNTDLNFGAVVLATANGGAVTLNPTDGSRNCDGGSGDILCSGTTALATFSIGGGTTGKEVRIDFSGLVDLVNDTPSGVVTADETIVLSNMTANTALVAASGGVPAYYKTSIVGGTATTDFAVGGTITFDGAEELGTYTGSFVVSVDYL
jgi:hypothetical protein